MDFLWNGYGFKILEDMDYGMDMDLVLNPSGPTVHSSYTNNCKCLKTFWSFYCADY